MFFSTFCSLLLLIDRKFGGAYETGMPFTIKEEAIPAETFDSEEGPLEHTEEQDPKELEDMKDENGDEQEHEDDQLVIDQGLANTLDSLTGCPRAEDTLLFALPVCAPYDVMLPYKYKVRWK